MFKKIFLLIFFLILFSSFSTAWLFPDQPFRIPIKITSQSNLSSYQILIDLNNTSLIGDNNTHFWINTRTDGKDIRFSNGSDTIPLDYFREFFNDDQNAHLWVEIPTLAVGDQNIFMYYGSNSSDDNSNFERTFVDDGNGTTILGWTLVKDSQNDWASNGTQYVNTSTGGLQQMYKSKTIANALSYAVSIEMQGNGGTTEVNYFLFDEANTNTPFVRYLSTTDQLLFYPSGTDGPSPCTISISDGTLYDINITRDYSGTWRMYANNTSCSIQDTTDTSGTDNGFWRGGNNTAIADNLYIKSTNSGGEPTYTIQNFQDNENLSMRIVDEENNSPLQPTLTVNGLTVDVNSNGYFDINTALLSYPVTISASLTGYDTRSFEYATPEGLANGSILGLRTNTEAVDIEFTFYGPDETTSLPLYYIEVNRGGVVSARGKTNSSAEVTFNLASQDSTYTINIFSLGSDTNVLYNYSTVSVTVNIPKDETTNVSVSPNNFNLDVGGLGLQSYSAQTLPINTIVIIGNTTDAYTLRIVDNNSNGQQYFARNYILNDKGNATSVVINPYLISINDGILVNLKVADLSTNQTVPNIRIQMKIGIGGTLTTVEDQITDSAGIAQVVMLSQKTYSLYITSINQDINYFNGPQLLTPSNQNFTIWINYSSNQITINQDNTLITIFPTTTAIVNNPQRIDVNVDTTAPHDFIYVQAYDSNTLVDQNNCSSSPCHVALTLNFNNFDTNFLNIKVIIQNQDFNFTRTISYYTAPFLNSIVTRVQNLKNEIGPVTLGVIMFAVIFGLIAFLGSNGLGNNMSQIFLIVITAGVFYFLWFYDVTKLFGGELFVAFLAGLFGVMLIYFWARQKGGP